ncbi:hypothetical protein [Tessaracoccus sp. O5.2]|uniref:hypothetical protein n=1 Tax=Tessaracoccus sp. O5.2 TaxID=3157622 RepID=UPI0036D778A5
MADRARRPRRPGKRARDFFSDPSLAEGALPADDTIMFGARWSPEPLPPTADGALALLERAYVPWRDGVAALDDDALLQPLGPKGSTMPTSPWPRW